MQVSISPAHSHNAPLLQWMSSYHANRNVFGKRLKVSVLQSDSLEEISRPIDETQQKHII